jgi:lysyl-tRNA synthetase class 2
MNWKPTATIENLRERAAIINQIRQFFIERDVLEVETPLLGRATIPDPNIHSMTVNFENLGAHSKELLYLQTSPEFAMKRLLSAGSGSIFQICKAFRNGEVGSKHNPEFTMLEWYRVGFDFRQLMEEVSELVQLILKTKPATQLSYQQAFVDKLQIDPLTCSVADLQNCAQQHDIRVGAELSKDDWLNLLFSYLIEPELGKQQPIFIFHYPISQAALSRASSEDPRVAERFELYYQGMELANGFGELTDGKEQRARFEKDLSLRKQSGLPAVPIDEEFLAALEKGLPDCSGVAVGVDRLLMLALQTEQVRDVLSFGFV